VSSMIYDANESTDADEGMEVLDEDSYWHDIEKCLITKICAGEKVLYSAEFMVDDVSIKTPEQLHKIIETRKPLGMFVGAEGAKWVAIDNRTGDAWTEEFDSFENAVEWVTGKGEADA